MNVNITYPRKISVDPPTAAAGDYIVFRACKDVLIGLTACSAEASNNGSFSEIQYPVLPSLNDPNI
jgi:hypothetical protein